MKIYSKDGIELMDLKSFGIKGTSLELKGKMMSSMSMTALVKPEDLWSAFRIMPWGVIVRLPWLMLKGWRVSRAAVAPHVGA